jgi:chemotaxis protein methyltransferase CheR
MTISQEQFCSLTSLLKHETAVVVGSDKEYLIDARLSQIAHEEGFSSIAGLVDHVLAAPKSPLAKKVLLALTTAETSFFRDLSPFETLRTIILPNIFKLRHSERTLSIWSIGCASGQELYSLAMILAEHFSEWNCWDVHLVGSDINPRLVNQATSGVYSHLEINRGLPSRLLLKYFIQVPGGFQVCDTIRSRVSFVERNILESWKPFQADVILCRNTLIYFDLATRKRVLSRIHSALAPYGYLLLGTAESTRHLHPGFKSADIPGVNAFVKTAPAPHDSSSGGLKIP